MGRLQRPGDRRRERDLLLPARGGWRHTDDQRRAGALIANAIAQLVPNQHGAWAALGAAYILGAFALANPGVATLLLALPLVCTFLARYAAARRNTPGAAVIAYVGISILVGLVLVFRFDRPLLVPMGIAGVAFVLLSLEIERRRRDRTTIGELVGMVFLSAALPAAAYTTAGAIDVGTIALWALIILFLWGSVFRVRYRVRKRSGQRATPSVLYHLGALGVGAMLAAGGAMPPVARFALLPGVVHALWMTRQERPNRPPIRRIGFEELAHTVVFVAITLFAYRG
jgi:hypothetical protein